MKMSQATRFALLSLTLCLAATGCTNQEVSTPGDVDKPAAPIIPTNSTQEVSTTGSAFLNGYQILPTGTSAVCATHEGTRTIIVGDMPSKSAASVIMDERGVKALSIADAEDNVEFTDYSVPVEISTTDGVTTVTGKAEGTRVQGTSNKKIQMTFVITAECI
ncbi:lipoprotein LpqH [Corynebacterium sp. H128]|uniref:lipoprotein LpqH n=1 Tax=unclassified Corynebacterium TaxID=2624378 RepID=UPI00309D0796